MKDEINTDSIRMQEITARFTSHIADQAAIEKMRTIRRYVRQLAYQIEALCPPSNAKYVSLTALSTVMTEANFSIVESYPLDKNDV